MDDLNTKEAEGKVGLVRNVSLKGVEPHKSSDSGYGPKWFTEDPEDLSVCFLVPSLLEKCLSLTFL